MKKLFSKYELHVMFQRGELTFQEFERLAIMLGYLTKPIDEKDATAMPTYTIDLSHLSVQEVNALYIDRVISHQEYMAYLKEKEAFYAA